MALSSSGSVVGLSRIYVDSRAGGANADGSASKPFDTFAEALEAIPDVSDESSIGNMILRMRTIVVSGNVGDITVDKPVAIENTTGIIGTLTCTAPMLMVTGGFITALDLTETSDARIQNTAITDVTLDDASATFAGCVIGTITLEGSVGGDLAVMNSLISEELTVPAEYMATAYSSVCMSGVVGTIADYNSGVDNGT